MIRLDYEPTDAPADRPPLLRRIINHVIKVRPLMQDGGRDRPPSPRERRALLDLRDMLAELEEDE